MPDTKVIEKLTSAEKWFRDGLKECGLAESFECVEADVSRSAELLSEFRAGGGAVRWSALFVKAAALALDRNPELNQLVAGNRRLRPDSVDICLSVSSEQAITPVIVVEDSARRNIEQISGDIARLTPLALEADLKMIALLNRWGFVGFTDGLRRALVRFLLNRLWYRRKVSGTFQVSSLPSVDMFAPFRFNTAGALGIGEVKERPVVVKGAVVARPTVMLTCCFNHAVWNGADAARFLNEVKRVLEEADFGELR